jgi:hypothetical protein
VMSQRQKRDEEKSEEFRRRKRFIARKREY